MIRFQFKHFFSRFISHYHTQKNWSWSKYSTMVVQVTGGIDCEKVYLDPTIIFKGFIWFLWFKYTISFHWWCFFEYPLRKIIIHLYTLQHFIQNKKSLKLLVSEFSYEVAHFFIRMKCNHITCLIFFNILVNFMFHLFLTLPFQSHIEGKIENILKKASLLYCVLFSNSYTLNISTLL